MYSLHEAALAHVTFLPGILVKRGLKQGARKDGGGERNCQSKQK